VEDSNNVTTGRIVVPNLECKRKNFCNLKASDNIIVVLVLNVCSLYALGVPGWSRLGFLRYAEVTVPTES
jgi:hypothetical protein